MSYAGVLAATVALGVGLQASQQTPEMPMSPRGTAATQVAGKWVEEKPGASPRYHEGKWIVVDYGRPILRGRTQIFGAGEEYGKRVASGAPVWRAGANETTRLRTEVPLMLGGQTVPAGEYNVFVELKDGAWTLLLSNQPVQAQYDRSNKTELWGAYNYDPKFIIARAPMTLSTLPFSVDQFTIGFVNMTQQGGALVMWWENQQAQVEFKLAS